MDKIYLDIALEKIPKLRSVTSTWSEVAFYTKDLSCLGLCYAVRRDGTLNVLTSKEKWEPVPVFEHQGEDGIYWATSERLLRSEMLPIGFHGKLGASTNLFNINGKNYNISLNVIFDNNLAQQIELLEIMCIDQLD